MERPGENPAFLLPAMQIRKINEGEFHGEGFKLRLSRDYLSYSDSEKHIEIECESLSAGGVAIGISTAGGWMQKGHFLRATTAEERDYLRTVITAALSQTKTAYTFE